MVQRLRATQEAYESEAKEEEFYLKALIAKSERRLQEGRPAAIDMISKNLHLVEQFDFDLVDPWKYFSGLLYEDMANLADEIREYKTYDKYDESHSLFWNALYIIAELEVEEARKKDEADRALLRSKGGSGLEEDEKSKLAPNERGLHPDVEDDIQAMLQGQTLGQLKTLEESVDEALESGDGDPEYWEAVKKRLQIHKAKAQVRDMMSQLFGRALKKMASLAAPKQGPEDSQAPDSSVPAAIAANASVPPAAAIGDHDEEAEQLLYEEEEQELRTAAHKSVAAAADLRSESVHIAGGVENDNGEEGTVAKGMEEDVEEAEEEADYFKESDGRYSPPPVDRLLFSGQDMIPEEEDIRQLDLLRQAVLLQEAMRFKAASNSMASISGPNLGTGIGVDNEMRMLKGNQPVHPIFRNLATQATDQFRTGREGAEAVDDINAETLASFRNQALRAMGSDGADRDFGGEVPLESNVYWWHEKYKPRKPKYFNRVHTGYEWNKYNQTHYDTDNPPPKVVQGYKFNILYHDLIDKQVAPTYRIEKDPQSADGSTCIIRFIAGPPYEDIAFRIVNKEWEQSHKRGFRCTFERGILHVYFNFLRTRYRR
ncbi:hypothetical protein CEUSTIGMA_g10643.t1 [Chlamydomonas eustigma]|uniref:Splicing factor Cactin n=1 Tax=Chlamydomonas eustigma TaxID=1157962 RepID=A0A250XJG7_9CHLO|nr:hypothetical protein CEUSTIGMA_g10643.t1 [Chlamydomonas eustigma]|eukprot:GAX83217.1 hypothetical protein CEUSTIGMA_g10643.t1 [Chlamydomonas eustigma]